jgi:transglutaminase-like putative cysteine protease
MRLKIQHVTHYTYSGLVFDNHNEARLAPLSNARQACLSFTLKTSPIAKIFHYDLSTGLVHHFNIRAPHKSMMISASSVVTTESFDPFRDMSFEQDDFKAYEHREIEEDYAEYLAASPLIPLGLDLRYFTETAKAKAAGDGASHFLLSLNRVLHDSLIYQTGATDVDTPVEKVLETKTGVCQDFAHLMIAVCRSIGIPARYASGYLCTRSVPESVAPQLKLIDLSETGGDNDALKDQNTPSARLIDGGSMHAWVECLLPSGIWGAFDPTNRLLADERYVTVHYGRDYSDALPMRGVYSGPQGAKMHVSVDIQPE